MADVLKKLRARFRKPPIPVISCRRWALNGTRSLGLDLGSDDYVSKTVRQQGISWPGSVRSFAVRAEDCLTAVAES